MEIKGCIPFGSINPLNKGHSTGTDKWCEFNKDRDHETKDYRDLDKAL